MTTLEIQRRIERLKKKKTMMQKYEDIWSGRITLREMLRKAGEKYQETPDWCALCMKEIEVCFHVHLEEVHKTNMKKLLAGGEYEIEDNELLLMMINNSLEGKD